MPFSTTQQQMIECIDDGRNQLAITSHIEIDFALSPVEPVLDTLAHFCGSNIL